MGRKLILPDSIKGEDFLKIMNKMPHGRNRIRLLAMHHVQSGKTLKEVAEIVHCHWITVQKWVKRFKEEGYDGLYESQRSGAPRKIGKQAESFIFNMLSKLSESTTGGYITGSQLHQIIILHVINPPIKYPTQAAYLTSSASNNFLICLGLFCKVFR